MESLYSDDDDTTSFSDVKGIYTIRIQTDPTLTLNEGQTLFVEQQTDEHIAGIICLGSCLFGPHINQHLRVYMNDTRSGIGQNSDIGDETNFESEPKQLNPAVMINEHFICVAPLFIERDGLNWFEYIRVLASSSKVHPLPNPIVMRYNCRFKTPITTSIVQFNLTDFLEGAVELCQWLGYAYTDFIDMVHLDNVAMTVVPM